VTLQAVVADEELRRRLRCEYGIREILFDMNWIE
jgi:hypothetical protein